MTRPAILDLDLVVVPREATDEMRHANTGQVFFFHAYSAMLSASPYPTAWDDVRKYVDGLERERNESIARETDAWRRANRAESRVKAWEGFVVVRDLPRLAVPTKDFGPGEQDTVSVPKITPEKLTEIIDRAEAAEARIAELEAELASLADLYGNEEKPRYTTRRLRMEVERAKAAADIRIADLEKEKHAALTMIAELEKRLADAERVIEPFADDRAKTTHANGCRYHGGHDCDCGKDDYLRAARAYMEGK